jgi:hypothetical protein
MKISRTLAALLAIVVCLLLSTAALAATDWSFVYLGRLIRWGLSDIYDYQRFPERVDRRTPPQRFIFQGRRRARNIYDHRIH